MGNYRVDFAGALHHLYQRGNEKQDIFRDDDDRGFFLGYLAKLKQECGFKLHALCLMSNHFHWLIETGPVALAKVMHRFETAYAMRFNAKYERAGHLFQGPYKAKLCTRDGYYLRLLRYIHRNPVRARLVPRCADWRWSGHAALASGRSGLIDTELALSFFGANLTDACSAYRAYADDAVDDGWKPHVTEGTELDTVQEIADLLRAVADIYGCSPAELASGSRKRALTGAKREFAKRALASGFTQADVARTLRCSEAAVLYLRRKIT